MFHSVNKDTFQLYVRKHTFGHVHPAKVQIRLHICAVWSEPSLGAFWISKDTKLLHADNEDYNQIAQVHSLIWVFVGYTCQKVCFNMWLILYCFIQNLITWECPSVSVLKAYFSLFWYMYINLLFRHLKILFSNEIQLPWPWGYKTSFMLNSAEHEICPANKSQIITNCKFFLAKHSGGWKFSANKYENANYC